MRQVLARLHVSAERVWPPKPSLHLAQHMYKEHDYDKHAHLSDPKHQKYFSLLAAWEHVLQHVAHHPDLAPHDFAICVEDDISLHDDLSLAAAQAAILHGFELARSDGWLYLGVCWPRCWDESAQVFQGLNYSRCSGECTHALAFTKHKAATMLMDLRVGMKDYMSAQGQDTYRVGEAIDQMMATYSYVRNGTWVAGLNLNSSHGHQGLFYQDRDRFHPTIEERETVPQ